MAQINISHTKELLNKYTLLILEGKRARILAIADGVVTEEIHDAEEPVWKERTGYFRDGFARSISDGQAGLAELKKRFYKEIITLYKVPLSRKIILFCPEEDISMIKGLLSNSQLNSLVGVKSGAYVKTGQNDLLEIAKNIVTEPRE